MEELAGNAVIARPHFAQVMVRHGYVSTNREAFDRYLDTDEYQKIERFKVSARDCIAAIRSDGGRAALAHPYQLGLDDERLEALIRQLKDSVLEAIECFYPRHTPEQTAFYLELARRYDLHVTGGSDKASTTNKRNCKEFVIQHKFNTKTALCNLPSQYFLKSLKSHVFFSFRKKSRAKSTVCLLINAPSIVVLNEKTLYDKRY